MALVKCPECGKENVSDSAEACPECGFGIKAYYEKIRDEEEKRNQQEELEQKRQEEKEKNEKQKEDNVRKRKETINMLFGSPMKKVLWIIIGFLCIGLIVVISGYIIKQQEIRKEIEARELEIERAIENGKSEIDTINEYVVNIDRELRTEHEYEKKYTEYTIEYVKKDLDKIKTYSSWVDANYKTDDTVKQAIDDYVKEKTTKSTWSEYKEYLFDNYYICETAQESAESLVNKVPDMTEAEKRAKEQEEKERMHSNSLYIAEVNCTTSGTNYKIYGTVTNNTSSIVKFVKVKVSLVDADEKVIDTETTYACGDEGIAPGESTKYECFIKKDTRTKSYQVEIYDYD